MKIRLKGAASFVVWHSKGLTRTPYRAAVILDCGGFVPGALDTICADGYPIARLAAHGTLAKVIYTVYPALV